MTEQPAVLVDMTDTGVATITMNRPDNMNAMNLPLVEGIDTALRNLSQSNDVRVLVLTGAGSRSFCPGADIKHFVGEQSPAAGVTRPAVADVEVPVRLREFPVPVIAAINGACAGAGFGLACACDLRVSSRSAVFRSAFAAVGVAGDFGVPWTLPRIVGESMAKEIMYLDEKFSAADALAMGLVSRVWDDDTFRANVAAMAETIAAKAPMALRSMKRHFAAAQRLDFRDFIELEFQRHFHLLDTADALEGFMSFAERRDPKFTNR
jgi:2-(1,2-epoxy-1,2-dihydrophenyl)acetyl-CoA isomerase